MGIFIKSLGEIHVYDVCWMPALVHMATDPLKLCRRQCWQEEVPPHAPNLTGSWLLLVPAIVYRGDILPLDMEGLRPSSMPSWIRPLEALSPADTPRRPPPAQYGPCGWYSKELHLPLNPCSSFFRRNQAIGAYSLGYGLSVISTGKMLDWHARDLLHPKPFNSY